MAPEHSITFGPFRLGLETSPARLWRDEQALLLRPRALASFVADNRLWASRTAVERQSRNPQSTS